MQFCSHIVKTDFLTGLSLFLFSLYVQWQLFRFLLFRAESRFIHPGRALSRPTDNDVIVTDPPQFVNGTRGSRPQPFAINPCNQIITIR